MTIFILKSRVRTQRLRFMNREELNNWETKVKT